MIIRRRGKTESSVHPSLADALSALRSRTCELADARRPQAARALGRDYDPVRQVAVRAELRGPRGLRAGVDVRGDGSTEAFSGWLVKRVVLPEPGEDAYATLERIAAG